MHNPGCKTLRWRVCLPEGFAKGHHLIVIRMIREVSKGIEK